MHLWRCVMHGGRVIYMNSNIRNETDVWNYMIQRYEIESIGYMGTLLSIEVEEEQDEEPLCSLCNQSFVPGVSNTLCIRCYTKNVHW